MTDPSAGWKAFVWFHSIDLGNGNVTNGTKSLTQIKTEEALFLDGIDLRGAEVIDIGACNGAFTFAASRRGAQRVLAVDSYVWSHPVFRGKEAFDLAHAALRVQNVETRMMEVDELSPETVGLFDVGLFLGVLYHLPSPLEALEHAASVVRECLVVETQTGLNDIEEPALVYYPGASLNNDVTNYFGPNVPFLIEALRELGFARFDVYFSDRDRVVLHAWRADKRRKFPGFGAIEFHSPRPASRYAEAAQELDRMRTSRSWRLTAPLRRLMHLIAPKAPG